MATEPEYAPDRFERSIAAIEARLDDLGIGRRAIFDDVGEGTIFPDGSESTSGHVVGRRAWAGVLLLDRLGRRP